MYWIITESDSTRDKAGVIGWYLTVDAALLELNALRNRHRHWLITSSTHYSVRWVETDNNLKLGLTQRIIDEDDTQLDI